jgi:hypothetical protein
MVQHDKHSGTSTSASAFAELSILDETTGTQTRANAAIRRKLRSVDACRASLWFFLLALGLALAGTSAAAPAVSYALTTATDPVRPGQVVQFKATVSNLTAATQFVVLTYHVPNFTVASGTYVAGTQFSYGVGYVAAGVSQSFNLDFTVLAASQAPNGSPITLVLSDLTRSISVTRTVTVRTAPAATLDLSTQQGTVAPGGSFAYNLAYHNAGTSTLSGSQLSLPVPPGASFVSADSGGVLGSDGVVRWSLSALAAGATGEVNLSLKASTTTGARPALLLQAAWKDSGGQTLAQASDAKVLYALPALSYALTTTTDLTKAGQVVQFKVTVSNLTATSQFVAFDYHVPNFTAYGSYPAGSDFTYTVGYVVAGTSQSFDVDLTVLAGAQAPPNGSLINLLVSDQSRGASVSRTVTVRTAPVAGLDLSTEQSTVAPGGSFAYTLTYHNAGGSTLSGSQLSLPVPAGATFASADGGGVLGSDGVVRWTLNPLPAGATGEVNLNLKASTTTGARPPLLVQAAWKDSSGQILTQASDAKVIYAVPAVSYALTTTTDPVGAGQVVQFKVTVSNLTTAAQYVVLTYHVPNFTVASSTYVAGTQFSYGVGYVAAGVSRSFNLDFTVLQGTEAPLNGSLITLLLSDQARGASVSRTTEVRSAPVTTLDLSTQQGTVAPGGSFAYSLAYHNAATSTLSGSQLSLPVPPGASFVSADGGGVLGSDGVVRWALSGLAAGATGEVNLNLKASTTTGARPALLLQAAWKESGGQILAQASDAKLIYAAPALSYALTTTTDPDKAGQVVQFKVTVSNLTATSQFVAFDYHVPNFTAYGSYPAGSDFTYTVGYVAAGTSQSFDVDLTVLAGAQAPPNGSLINLLISDQSRGASVSRTVTVRTAPAAALDLSTQQGTVGPGGSFAYTLTYHNAGGSTLSGSQLSLPVPAGASFVSADGGGALGSDEVVRWTLSPLAAGATGEVSLNLKASTTTGARPPLLVQAAWKDSSDQILSQASDAKVIYAVPAVSYAVTTTTDPVGAGQVVQFKVTVSNLTTAAQFVVLAYHVPNFTVASGTYVAGTQFSYGVGYVAAGVSQSFNLAFTVLSASQAPKGSLINLLLSDQARGASVSRTAMVQQ